MDKINVRVIVSLLVAVISCGCGQRPQSDAYGTADEEGYVLINGSCRGALAHDAVPDLNAHLIAKENSLGFVRIRSSASFAATDESNLLGTVACGTKLRGLYGVKDPELGNALGCYVRIRDLEGRKGIGYVAGDVVELDRAAGDIVHTADFRE